MKKLTRKEKGLMQILVCTFLAVAFAFTFPKIGIGEIDADAEYETTIDTTDLDEVQDFDVSIDDSLESKFFISNNFNIPIQTQIDDLSDVDNTTNTTQEPENGAPNSSAQDDITTESTEPEETTTPTETQPIETEPKETIPPETEPPETEPVETEPPETQPKETEPIETTPPETKPATPVIQTDELSSTYKYGKRVKPAVEINPPTDGSGKNYTGYVDTTQSNFEYLGACKITGYDPNCEHCNGSYGNLSASGLECINGYTVAMSKMIPLGTTIYIEGYGFYVVEDRGVGNYHIDIACGSHSQCYDVTAKGVNVWIVRPV